MVDCLLLFYLNFFMKIEVEDAKCKLLKIYKKIKYFYFIENAY